MIHIPILCGQNGKFLHVNRGGDYCVVTRWLIWGLLKTLVSVFLSAGQTYANDLE